MSNLTLSLDKNLLKRARLLALKHDTTVNAMVRDYLEREVSKHEKAAESSIEVLEELFEKTQVPLGGITWTRDELHER
ncbi:MAG: DUF6364 family protein [Spirochaetia bacterium]